MKKIILALASIALLIFMTACNKNYTVRIKDIKTTYNTVSFILDVTDKKNAISENSINYYLFDEKNEQTNNGTVDDMQFGKKQTISKLKSNKNYKLVIKGTVNRKSIELASDSNIKTALEGSSENAPIEISTVEEFIAIKDNVAAYYVLKNDIDFSGYEKQYEAASTFNGSIDGDNFTVKNLKISNSPYSLFGTLDKATIKDIKLDNIEVNSFSSSGNFGILARKTEGSTKISNITITNSTLNVKGSRSDGTTNVGVVIGESRASTVMNIYLNNNKINYDAAASSAGKVNIGGAFGYIYEGPGINGKIENNNFEINFNDKASETPAEDVRVETVKAFEIRIGGIVGLNSASITEIIANGNITVNSEVGFTDVYTGTPTKEGNNKLIVGGLIAETGFAVSEGIYKGIIDVKATAKTPVETETTTPLFKDIQIGGVIGVIGSSLATHHFIKNIGRMNYAAVTDSIKVIGDALYSNYVVDILIAKSHTQVLDIGYGNNNGINIDGTQTIPGTPVTDVKALITSEWVKEKIDGLN